MAIRGKQTPIAAVYIPSALKQIITDMVLITSRSEAASSSCPYSPEGAVARSELLTNGSCSASLSRSMSDILADLHVAKEEDFCHLIKADNRESEG